MAAWKFDVCDPSPVLRSSGRFPALRSCLRTSGHGIFHGGHAGADRRIEVPLGTVVTDVESGDGIGEITGPEEVLLVAQGGAGGAGNTCFKSSTNRTPTRIVPGGVGEERTLHLELQLLADVGLVGAAVLVAERLDLEIVPPRARPGGPGRPGER